MRSNIDERWHKVAKAGGSQTISKISAESADAYLLSESSLFVWDDSVLMVTCGRTSLISALPEILNIVDRDKVAFIFYERKNFMFPHEQPSDFESDAARLLKFFPGKSYRLGPANHDHLHVFYWAHPHAVPEPDATFQVLMNDLPPSVMDMFCQETADTPAQAEKRSGLEKFYPREAVRDSHLFLPSGFSMNGIFRGKYFTIHVAPQSRSSYASFETNIIETDYSGTIQEMVSVFRPGKFSIALTTSMDDHFLSLHSTVANVLSGYSMTEKSLYKFDCGYTITFLNYIKNKDEDL